MWNTGEQTMKFYAIIMACFLSCMSCNRHIPVASPEYNDFDIKSAMSNKGYTGWNSLVCVADEGIYFITKQGIKKWTDQVGEVLLFEDKDINGMVFNEPWIYYACHDNMEIYRINLDSEAREFVISAYMIPATQEDDPICGFTVYDEKLYIMNTIFSCFEYDLETETLREFNHDVSSGVFLNNAFYFIDRSQRSFSIYKKNLETGVTELVRGDGITFQFGEEHNRIQYDSLAIVNGSLFYSTRFDAAIYQYQEDGQDLLISDFAGTDIKILDATTDGRYLYYSCTSTTNILYKYDPVESKVIAIEAPDDFKSCWQYMVVQDVLYYNNGNDEIRSFDILQN